MLFDQYNTPEPIVVIDIETSGLDETRDIITEVAWWHLGTPECGVFVPPHSVNWVLENGDSKALEISQYRERLATAPQDTDGSEMLRFARTLNRKSWCGANPTFDILFLSLAFREAGFPRQFWHHRPIDVESYGAGVLRLNYIPGLYDLCLKLSVEPPTHRAQDDVLAAGRCMLALVNILSARS